MHHSCNSLEEGVGAIVDFEIICPRGFLSWDQYRAMQLEDTSYSFSKSLMHGQSPVFETARSLRNAHLSQVDQIA